MAQKGKAVVTNLNWLETLHQTTILCSLVQLAICLSKIWLPTACKENDFCQTHALSRLEIGTVQSWIAYFHARLFF